MRALSSLLLILGLVLPAPGLAKNAEDFFHGAANFYVQGRLQEAGNEVEQGLREYPGDARLSGLSTLLKQIKDQQRQDQNQKNQDPNKDQDKSKEQEEDQGQKQDEKQDQGQGEQGKEEPEKKSDQEKESQDPGQPDSSQSPRDSSQGSQAEPPKPGQMSKEEAERLLNSFENDEKQSQRDRQAPRKRVDVEEDW